MALTRNRNKEPQSTEDAAQVIGETFGETTPIQQQEIAVRPRDQIASEVASQPSAYDRDTLRQLNSFDAAVALATEAYGPVEDVADELGDGFALLDSDHKGRLIDVPLLFLEWSFYPGEFGSKFVAARVMARNPDGGTSKYIVNDGSTGIADQLAEYSKRTGKYGGLMAKRGLRASEYTYCELCRTVQCENSEVHRSNGAHKKASTYYIDTAA